MAGATGSRTQRAGVWLLRDATRSHGSATDRSRRARRAHPWCGTSDHHLVVEHRPPRDDRCGRAQTCESVRHRY